MRHLVMLLAAGIVLASCSPSSTDQPTSFATGSRLLKVEKAVPGRYIVVLEEKALAGAQVGLLARQLATLHGATVDRVYSRALQGFAARMPEAAALRLSNDPRVRYVEEDSEVSISVTQQNATWGLDRIDQRALPLDRTYSHAFTGSGVNVYVIDTGIYRTHSEFGGRAIHGFSANPNNSSWDCNGHGTHVAGTIGGATYGVAKGVTLHAVQVLDCDGTGYASDVVAGVDWVTVHHIKPAVANMSLGGYSEAISEAVAASIDSGVIYAVSAGNTESNACGRSPAGVESALTVGATDMEDYRPSWSNFGPCVDLFAPGVNVTSAWITDSTSARTLSGTSMSAPHVAGVAALFLEGSPLATPKEVSAELIARATPDKIHNPYYSPNRLLYSGCTGDDRTPPQVVLTAPSSGTTLSGTVTLTATAMDNVGVTKVAFYLGNRLIGSDATAPYALVWDSATASNGSGVLTARVSDANCNQGVSVPVDVTIQNTGNATFDATWGAPACTSVGSKCDSVWLLEGRADVGPELHQPNTVGGSCADGLYGRYRMSPSLERLVVSRGDGTPLAAGKEVTVQATVYAVTYLQQQVLDLYAAPDANAPQWTHVASLQPSQSGLQVLSTTYLLPAGGLQVLRAVYRPDYYTSAVCLPHSNVDHDDLVLAVGQETDSTPPSVAITSPSEGAPVEEVVVFSVEASDNFGVQRVELYDGSTLVATDFRPPFSLSWASRTVPNGSRTFTARAYDATGLVSTSAPVSVLVNNDYVPPQVSFLTPKDGETVFETISLEVNASDNRGVARVDFYLDGQLINAMSATPYKVSWSPRATTDGPHVLSATARDLAGNVSSQSTVNVVVKNDFTPPATAITAPANGTTLTGLVSIEASASDNWRLGRVEFFVDGALIGSDTTAPYSISWDSLSVVNGSHTLTSKAYDWAEQATTSAPITVETLNRGNARYDPVLKAPRCDSVEDRCDTWNLVKGRAQLGPELNTPNTLDGCLDGTQGVYRSEESIERIRVIREDGQPMVNGQKVRLEVDVWSYSSYSDVLDLYYAADANQPSWTHIASLTPQSFLSAQRLSVEYVLPVGSLQAVRANFRFNGSPSPCSPGSRDDHDDLVFPVGTDSVPPTVALTAPISGAAVRGGVTLSASASDNANVVAVDFFVGETLLGTDTSAPFSVGWNTLSVPNGGYTLTARARDSSGLLGTSQPVTVTVDNDYTAPVVSITSPAQGATVMGRVQLTADATDDVGVTRIELYEGSRLLGTHYGSPLTLWWDTQKEPAGEHVLTARAYDAAGNRGNSEQVVVTVVRDTTPPSVSISSPAHGDTLSGRLWVSAVATDNLQVEKVELFVDGTLVETDTFSSAYFLWDTKTATNGSHTLSARATDSYGNVATSAVVSVTVDNDTLPPVASITSPAQGATVSGTLSVQVSATDVNRVSYVKLLVDGASVGTDSSSPYTFSWNTKLLSNGTHTLAVESSDTLGNVGTSAPISVTVDNDTTAPAVSITSPASGATVGSFVSIHADATDNKGVTRVDFFVNHVLLASDTTAPFSATWSSFSVATGSHTLTAKAYDAAGYSTTSAAVTVDVTRFDSAAFEPALHAPACTTVNNLCDTKTLVAGRHATESNAPNTLGSCGDGQVPGNDSSPRIERLQVSRVYGEYLAEGKRARVDVHVMAATPSTEALDLFYTSDATNPSWTYLTTLQPSGTGAQVLSTEYVLPAGSLQAVRAQYRVGGSNSSSCSSGSFDDRDDVAFAVGLPSDGLKPTVTITSPAADTWLRSWVLVTATADDDLAVAKVEFFADGRLLGSDTSAPYEVPWWSTQGGDGAHTLTARAYDNGGRTTSASVVVNTDNTSPQTVLISPTPGALLRGTVVVEATASDNRAVTKVEFFNGGWQMIGSSLTAPYAASWNTANGSDGTYRLHVKAHDSTGNITTTSEVWVTVDNTPPTTALSAPAQNAFLRGTVQLSATASDTVGLQKVEFYAGQTLLGTVTTAPYDLSWDTTTAASGSVTLTTWAYDTAGNVTVSAGRTVTVDNTAPTVAITSPANGASLFLNTTVQASAGDNIGVTQVVFYDGATVIGTDTTAPYSVSWSLLNVPKGQHTLTAKAHDAAGHVTTSAPITVKVN